MEVFRLRLSDGSLTRLTHNHIPDPDPAFSPDGRKVVFAHGAVRNYEILSMRRDGTAKRRVDVRGGQDTDIAPNWGPTPR